jgi:hypothetical protein
MIVTAVSPHGISAALTVDLATVAAAAAGKNESQHDRCGASPTVTAAVHLGRC